MNLGILYSGGKDSNYSMYLAKQAGHEIICLITMISENKESYMFQTASVSKTEKQAEAMGLPIIKIKTKGIKEEELVDLKKAIKRAIDKYKIEGIVTGALDSVYQASRIQGICDELEIRCINPLWHKNPEEYWREILDLGFKVMIVRVSAEGLGREWLGMEINKENYEELKRLSRKHNFHLGFEGGEAETFVLWQPMFRKELKVINKKISGDGRTWKMEIEVEAG
ncbi:diphthine--ammonia ligase [Candidatus Pacearchaeota archaeon]|nr:diphthine--ammonia ligase [Candidatus Pacearchaeota archaeon]